MLHPSGVLDDFAFVCIKLFFATAQFSSVADQYNQLLCTCVVPQYTVLVNNFCHHIRSHLTVQFMNRYTPDEK